MIDARLKNFGYAKQPKAALTTAVKQSFGHGHFRRSKALCRIAGQFADFFQDELQIRDVRAITQADVEAWGAHVAERVDGGEIGVDYGHELICGVNVTLECIRGDKNRWISPAGFAGKRCTVRTTVPDGLDPDDVLAAANLIEKKGFKREAVMVRIARFTGLRMRECLLLDAKAALAQARERGEIRIVRGDKNGRGKWVERWVPVDAEALAALEDGVHLQGEHDSFIPPVLRLITFLRHFYRHVPALLKECGIDRMHELRAAFACSMYERITGYPAPVVAGHRVAPRLVDQEARRRISAMLGHSRVQILARYIGSAK